MQRPCPEIVQRFIARSILIVHVLDVRYSWEQRQSVEDLTENTTTPSPWRAGRPSQAATERSSTVWGREKKTKTTRSTSNKAFHKRVPRRYMQAHLHLPIPVRPRRPRAVGWMASPDPVWTLAPKWGGGGASKREKSDQTRPGATPTQAAWNFKYATSNSTEQILSL